VLVRRTTLLSLVAGGLLTCLAISVQARVLDLHIDERQVVAGGAPFGDRGAYERLRGTVTFSVDPANSANAAITDITLAPRGESGGVEAQATFMVLKPTDAERASGVGFFEVSNRGGKAALGYFNAAPFSTEPMATEDFGDGLLMRMGLTVIWVGWQFDVPGAADRLRLHVPVATDGDQAITGLVRSDWVVDGPATHLHLGHKGHTPYPVADPDDERNVLYERSGRDATRQVVPRNLWRFTAGEDAAGGSGLTNIAMEDGFRAGRIYELVYVSTNPALVGLGLAAVRDMMSYALHDESSPFAVSHGIAFGVSQTGRFLRQFLYQGFNRDESDRKVFDGMLIHTAGAGRGSFNHRFGQPSRDAHRFSAFFYPTDLYPFTSQPSRDAVTGRDEGLLDRLASAYRPKVMVTNTGYEYWGRAASLIHITPSGDRDVAPAPDERIYHLASGQHYVSRRPPDPDHRLLTADGWRGNPLDFLVNLRALLSRLVEWVRDDVAPPASRYPTIETDSLVRSDRLAFPDIPGITLPASPHLAYRADYGPDWGRGIVSKQPPWLGPPFQTLVPQVDGLGNETGGVRNVEIRVPLATYTPWSLREGLPVAGEMRDFTGQLLPLPGTSAEAAQRHDPRPSVEELYADRGVFTEAVRDAADQLVSDGFLLPEDRDRVMARNQGLWDLITQRQERAP